MVLFGIKSVRVNSYASMGTVDQITGLTKSKSLPTFTDPTTATTSTSNTAPPTTLIGRNTSAVLGDFDWEEEG